MNSFNQITSAVFDLLLAPLGHQPAGFDMLLWPVLCGVVALIIWKYVSNQQGIEWARDQIKMHLLEIRLWRHDLTVVFGAVARILAKNAVYIGYNITPGLILALPFTIVLVQLEANYAKAPVPVGTVELLHVTLESDTEVKPVEVALNLPDGIVLDAPPVRTPDGEIFWRLRAETAGDHLLTLTAGDHELVKGWAVGGEPRKVPQMRTKSWEALLYPGEGGIPAQSPFYDARIAYPDRVMPWLWDGEFGVLMWFFVFSLLAGFALKDVFGVTL